MLSYVLAVLAAFGNATSSVLQRKANREVPSNQNLSWRLIWSLLHQPVWFGGILAICIGFLLQATAPVLWGVFAFHENVRGGWYIVPEMASAALLAAAVLALARSPLLADAAEET